MARLLIKNRRSKKPFEIPITIMVKGSINRYNFCDTETGGDIADNFYSEIDLDYDVKDLAKQIRDRVLEQIEKIVGFKCHRCFGERRVGGGVLVAFPVDMKSRDWQAANLELGEKTKKRLDKTSSNKID